MRTTRKSKIKKRPVKPTPPPNGYVAEPYDRVAEHNRANAEREAKGYPPMIDMLVK